MLPEAGPKSDPVLEPMAANAEKPVPPVKAEKPAPTDVEEASDVLTGLTLTLVPKDEDWPKVG